MLFVVGKEGKKLKDRFQGKVHSLSPFPSSFSDIVLVAVVAVRAAIDQLSAAFLWQREGGSEVEVLLPSAQLSICN